MTMQNTESASLLRTAEKRLRHLSFERLRVADDFLAYLEEREETEATEELLRIPGFLDEFQEAAQQLKDGAIVRFSDIRRQDV